LLGSRVTGCYARLSASGPEKAYVETISLGVWLRINRFFIFRSLNEKTGGGWPRRLLTWRSLMHLLINFLLRIVVVVTIKVKIIRKKQ